ncbi:MAG TPA: type III-B CRISPR module RAMP protein Cmr4 [Spirochaetes bacterium]|nr:type III-B CRISPR module RAMP protein Cmr4 [Spirochaetota bacterium]
MAEPFKKKKYFAMTLDPVHIGTGGYRLGRVDNMITREPGTNLPKIPGSSIAGVTRAYTAMAIQNGTFVNIGTDFKIDYKNYLKCKYQRPAYIFSKILDDETEAIVAVDSGNKDKPLYEGKGPDKEKYYSCAGKGADDGEGHCGRFDCEVCIPFGFSRGKSSTSFQGLAQFYDARILFFPVHSMKGPIWVTSPCILNEHGLSVTLSESDDIFKSFGLEGVDKLNFGWLMLTKDNGDNLTLTDMFSDVPDEIKNRLLLVSDKLFSRIVNDNLEVRTSVAIDPATGAAEDGALYTYEAIPRATVMWFDVIYNDPDYFRIGGDKKIALSEPASYRDPLRNPEKKDQVGYMAFNVEKGLAYLEHLGVGGMNTRGMGRLRILNMGGQINGNS